MFFICKFNFIICGIKGDPLLVVIFICKSKFLSVSFPLQNSHLLILAFEVCFGVALLCCLGVYFSMHLSCVCKHHHYFVFGFVERKQTGRFAALIVNIGENLLGYT